MIPRIVHQTWRDETIPERFREMAQSWRNQNPGWEYRLWTDADLERLVARHYPDFLDQYRAYANPVQRADAGRYFALHRFGGVYADLDSTCLASFEELVAEDRVVLAREPATHEARHSAIRRLPGLIANSVMASPAGHPFWRTVEAAMVRCRHAGDVLESTGPLLLSGCAFGWPTPDDLAIHSCHLFNAADSAGVVDGGEERGAFAPRRLAIHHWAGSWYSEPRETLFRRAKGVIRRMRHLASRGDCHDPQALVATMRRNGVAEAARAPTREREPNIAVFVPVRDAARHVEALLRMIDSLDYPRARLKLAFCEGGSADDTVAVLKAALARLDGYRDIRLIHRAPEFDRGGRPRWHPSIQRARRAAIARARNQLVADALSDEDEWVLWIDADVCACPPDALRRLLAAKAPIVAPDCVIEPGGRSFDLNSFLDTGTRRDSAYYKYCRDGLFQPPVDFATRRHLHDLRYLDRTPLTGVGGTMLLVKAALHRAGLVFPDKPYRELIETEAFGQLACDCGLTPIGLPNLEVRHARE